MSNNTRPLIGINTDYYAATKTYSAHARLNAGYFDAVQTAISAGSHSTGALAGSTETEQFTTQGAPAPKRVVA